MSRSTRVSSAPAGARAEAPDVDTRQRDLRGHSLLAVFSHPDDESLACGGLLAWCAALGAQVSLLCVTHGEHGPGHEDAVDLRATRAHELGAAAGCLGIATHSLLDYEDGMLPWAERARLEADIDTAIRRQRPGVVITFGEDGLYWHPDHIAIHEATTAVVAAMGTVRPALFYVTIPAGSMSAVVAHAAAEHARCGREGPPPRRILGISSADAFGAMAASPTLVIQTGEFATRKLAAIQCHRSQLIDSALTLVSPADATRLLGTEHYRRADVGAQGEAFIDRLGS